jgi:hypothetical protein
MRLTAPGLVRSATAQTGPERVPQLPRTDGPASVRPVRPAGTQPAAVQAGGDGR